MMGQLQHLPTLSGVSLENIHLSLPFEQAAARFAGDEGTILLLSGSDQDCARFHIMAAWPWLTLTGQGERMTLKTASRTWEVSQNPFDLLQDLMSRFQLESIPEHLPVAGGLFGYFSYDLKDEIETLPRTCMDSGLPDLALFAPSLLLVQDRKKDQTFLCIPKLEPAQSDPLDSDTWVNDVRERFFRRLDSTWEDQGFAVDKRGLVSSVTKSEYIIAVNRIIEYLRAGDIYQANYSQRFETGFSGDTYGLFLELFRRNPASFFSYIQASDHCVVSTSPERFISLDNTRVETRPIKGTLARGEDPDSDRRNGRILSQSPKDDAELTMIVDLMRNDLSRVTVHDSVVVKEHKRLEPYDNVFHLVSVVEGRLRQDKTAVDLLKATFPGGSITGCPKIRAMEIIDELEPVKRHVYTGSIGYISFHKTMDLSIAIRTATIKGDQLFFSVGGGIVFDSDPEKEYQETLDKGKTLMETLVQASTGSVEIPLKAWINGKITDQDRVMMDAGSPGVQYGAGLFETIRVEHGRPLFMDSHLKRMEEAWTLLFDTKPPDITWKDVVTLLVRENHLSDTISAVKLMIAKGRDQGNAIAAAFIRPYVHRCETLGKSALDLVVFPHPRQGILADHKTMNYLYYERAGAFARQEGADEALILNPDLTVSETNTCNIFALDNKTLVLPLSPNVLSGIVLCRLKEMLAAKGYEIRQEKMDWKALSEYPNVMVSNSLMGIVEVAGINGCKISHEPGLCDELNRLLIDAADLEIQSGMG